jgi:NAD(P)-dependent dehydrogenase (short-subunit alcohol dehydrogenase family)
MRRGANQPHDTNIMKESTFLITGGTSGIGLATAKRLGANGARVIITGRNPESLEEAKGQLTGGAVVLRCDSSSVEEATSLASQVRAHADKLSGVFLNAGVAEFAPFEQATVEQCDRMYQVHVRAALLHLQNLLPLLTTDSAVLLTASVAAEIGFPGASLYGASKAAVISLARTLAVELAPRGIRVNTLSPGPIDTPIHTKMGVTEEMRNGIASQTLLKRFGTPDEVARLACFLLTQESSCITGENITIDGGIRLT